MKRCNILSFVLLLMLIFSVVPPITAYPRVQENKASSDTSEKNRPADGSKVAKNNLSDKVSGGFRRNCWRLPECSEWKKFAKMDGDTVELVIGVDLVDEKAYTDLENLIRGSKGKIIKKISTESIVDAIVVGVSYDLVSSLVDRLETSNLPRYVEPNMKFEADFTPNDPYWDMQWGPKKIEADYAWNTTVGDHSVLVAIIDTGIDYNHPDLAPNYVPLGYDWVNDDEDPMDDHSHGTHCAGIVAAAINNAIGIAGVAQARIMAEKGLNSQGSGYEDDLANAIIHAVDQGANILSCSWGSESPSSLIEAAMEYAYSHGALVFASAGNTATDIEHFPAAYDEVVAVTATDMFDEPASFTTYGEWVEVSAPGLSIYSTIPGFSYASKSGTSMSCPHAAGVAALMLSEYPQLTNVQLRQAIRYATDDLGDARFDIYYGYGRVNARKGIEELPVNCDLALWNWSKPPYVEPGDTGLFNATIYNFGMNDVSDITVQLMANGSVVDHQTITHLSSDSLATVTLGWIPEIQGVYNVTVYVVPVSGETNTRFNSGSDYIDVGFPLKVVVLDSRGTDLPQVINGFWKRLNKEWRQFGDQMVSIDYTSLNKFSITYEDIKATGADVLLISFADLREYADEEIDAISKYVYEEHGLIATALSLGGINVPNNVKLAPVFGLSKIAEWNYTSMDTLNILDPTHPLFINIPASLNFTRLITFIPEDNQWDSNELQGGTYLALGDMSHTAIVAYRGLVYISADLEAAGIWPPPPPTTYQLQLFYNAMVWSKFQTPEHELIASLKAPGFVMPMETAKINATVSNIGLRGETNVTLQIIINGSILYSKVIASLPENSTYTIVYPWQPTKTGIYNVTTFVKPVAGEDNAWNNEASTLINVLVPPDILMVADNDEYENLEANQRTSLEEFKSALDAYGSAYYVWEEKIKGPPSLDLLKQFKLVIWTCGEAGDWVQITTSDASRLISYAKQGGKIILDGDYIALSHFDNIDFAKYVTHARYYGVTWPWLGGTEGLKVVKRNHLVVWGLPEEFRWGITPWIVQGIQPVYGGFGVVNYIDCPNPPPIDGPALPSVMSWEAIVLSEDAGKGGSTIFCAFPFFGMPEKERIRMMGNSLNWLFPREHELFVNVNSFKEGFHDVAFPAWINVTVTNWGQNNETNISLQILINGTLVDSKVVTQISTYSSLTYSYLWNPENTGLYNITVQVLPVLGEDVLYDNVVNELVNVRRLVVALISDGEELESIIPILESMEIGYHTYSKNKYYSYSKQLGLLSAYRIIIMDKSLRKSILTEHTALQSYLASGGNLLVTGADALLFEGSLDSYMSDIVRAKVFDIIVPREPPVLYVMNDSHPIMDGTYGKFNVGYTSSVSTYHIENATADTSRGAVTVAKVMSLDFPADKIIATSLIPGRVAYWNGEGPLDWKQKADCQAIFKNIISWLELGEFHDLEASIEVPDLIEPGKPVTTRVFVRNVGYYDENNLELHLALNDVDVSSVSIPKLSKRSLYKVEYDWTPVSEGIYNFTAYVTLVSNEINQTNNVYSISVNVRFWPHIVLTVPQDVQVDQTFSINITILNATSLCGWELELYYRNYVLNATSISEGTFLSPVGATVFQVLYFNDAYNATHGRIRLTCSLVESLLEVNGSGILATIAFKGKATGLCHLTLCNTRLIATTSPSYPHFHESRDLIVGLLGDLNNDGIVNIFDVVIVTSSYGSRLGKPSWNPQADVIPDGVINIFDVVKVTANYGKTRS